MEPGGYRMESPILFDDAFYEILRHMPSFGTERLPVSQALGRVLAQDAASRVNVPPFSRSMMDGYAIHADNLHRGEMLKVLNTVAAGATPTVTVTPGHAVRVMTGAPIPDGTAAVVRDEWCDVIDESTIQVLKVIVRGESIQHQGEDGPRQTKLLSSGTRLTELELAVLQTFGVTSIEVRKTPVATLLITGSELVQDTEQELHGGQIYGTNDILLRGALEKDGVLVERVAYIPDDPMLLQEAVETARQSSDLVILTGGVSVGDFDYTPSAIEASGSTIHIRKVLMRPGSPLLFATSGQTAFFGLSGNPAACFAQFSVLVRPAIRRAMGQDDSPFPHSAVLTHDLSLKPIKHTRVQRARLSVENGSLYVDSQMSQSSGVISSLLQTGAYIRVNESELKAGTVVPIRIIREL